MNYNPEIKEAAYRAYLKGESRKEISLQYNINLHTLCNWTKQWENFSRDEISMEDFGVIATRILALEKEKERLSCELEIIHKSGLLQQLPTSMRVEQVKALSTIYTAKLACRALEIKSATYYARKKTHSYGKRQKR